MDQNDENQITSIPTHQLYIRNTKKKQQQQ